MNNKVDEIYSLLNQRGKNGGLNLESLKQARIKIKRLAARKNISDLGSAGEYLLEPENLQYLDSLIRTYSGRVKSNDPNFDPLAGGSFWEDPVMLKKYIDEVPNFIDDLAKHFQIYNRKYLMAFDKGISNGKKSKRKTDSKIMESAKTSIQQFRENKSKLSHEYLNMDLKGKLSAESLFAEIKKLGFTGSLGWVKKHFATITKLS